jgi:hypothetical protein
MHHYLVELYTPNTTWQALPNEQRMEYLSKVGEALANLSSMGIEVLTLTETVSQIDQKTSHQFLGIWRFPDPQARAVLLDGIRASGWYQYFDHINAAGAEENFPQHIHALVNA